MLINNLGKLLDIIASCRYEKTSSRHPRCLKISFTFRYLKTSVKIMNMESLRYTSLTFLAISSKVNLRVLNKLFHFLYRCVQEQQPSTLLLIVDVLQPQENSLQYFRTCLSSVNFSRFTMNFSILGFHLGLFAAM